jgi:nicotinamidase-related amidase
MHVLRWVQVIDALKPAADEIVLPKTSSSVFNSTNIDFILRSVLGAQKGVLAMGSSCLDHLSGSGR